MESTKIPKAFNIFGLTVPTIWHNDMGVNIGEYVSHPLVIKLDMQLHNPIMKERCHQTYCHEVVHAWLSALGRTEMCKDEELVEQLGQCLHQFITSRKY